MSAAAGNASEQRRAGASHRYVVVDVFTDVPLQGNQLAVFTDASSLPAETLQPLARELNVSETVFVLAPEQVGDARVRIFTPSAELPFAGHPVLGTAIVLGVERALQEVTLETGAGLVPVALRRAEGDGEERIGYGSMRQPTPTWEPYEREAELLEALGVSRSELPVEVYLNGPRHVYVELDSEQAVAALRPDLRALAALGEARRQLLRRLRRALEEPHVRARARCARGSGDRLGGGPTRRPPGAPRQDRVRRGDRDPPGCRGRAPVAVARASNRVCRRARASRGGRLGGDRRAGQVRARLSGRLLSARETMVALRPLGPWKYTYTCRATPGKAKGT